MRRITLWMLSTVAALVLMFSYRTSLHGTAPVRASGASAPAPSASAAAGTQGSAAKTYQGSVAQTQWGPVQVTVTVSGGRITDVGVPTYPNGNHRDEEINAQALPRLKEEVLDAQSADIDTVSGATVTSDGYRQSLQAALDAAHLS
ncbi:FMN-binding protein [Actinomadura parmotrematis]|uniref:FMN-binding protein n=1 Tax=Actinomadura parmotrematis TaxID=2864039 RepID=A0ABS7FLG7_9ACTN|nr:FMN-binding protein [Actinomadura parmotrematis]MBW8481222.1 FMN-binding protein [Actinomadura parmotrematis]